eukprot:6214522-Pleurochrysis_carterae.AAC.2
MHGTTPRRAKGTELVREQNEHRKSIMHLMAVFRDKKKLMFRCRSRTTRNVNGMLRAPRSGYDAMSDDARSAYLTE